MSKKITRTRETSFMLETDGFSIHTFELSRKMTKHEWHHLKEKLYAKQSKRPKREKVWIYRDGKGCHRVTLFEEHGIRITLQHYEGDGHDSYYVYLAINPRKLIDPECSYLGILEPKESSIKALKTAFRKLLKDSVFENELDQYRLHRVDLCANIRCEHKKIFRETVRVLRKLPTPKKYKRVFSEHKDRKTRNNINKHYIQFVCGTHNLVIYDKTFQLEDQGLTVDLEGLPAGVLRFEVQYQRKMIRDLEKAQKTEDPAELLSMLMHESRNRIYRHFSYCFADVRFCQYDEIIDRIDSSRYDHEHKKAMRELVHRLRKKQTVDSVIEDMEKEQYPMDGILNRFTNLGISPIPLWQNFCAQMIPGPVELLERVANENVMVEYEKKKYK